MKKTKELEWIIKGVANHRRIQIMELIYREPELSVLDVSEKLVVNFKTISEHIRRLALAGLIIKRSDGISIRHKLTLRGITILKFLRTLE